MNDLIATYDGTTSEGYKVLPLCGPQEANEYNT